MTGFTKSSDMPNGRKPVVPTRPWASQQSDFFFNKEAARKLASDTTSLRWQLWPSRNQSPLISLDHGTIFPFRWHHWWDYLCEMITTRREHPSLSRFHPTLCTLFVWTRRTTNQQHRGESVIALDSKFESGKRQFSVSMYGNCVLSILLFGCHMELTDSLVDADRVDRSKRTIRMKKWTARPMIPSVVAENSICQWAIARNQNGEDFNLRTQNVIHLLCRDSWIQKG
jgi:hypothetical protein